MTDPLFRMLTTLPSVEPDAARSERVRMRCRAALASPSTPLRAGRPAQRRRPSGSQVWPLVAMLGVAYFAEVMRQAVSLYAIQ